MKTKIIVVSIAFALALSGVTPAIAQTATTTDSGANSALLTQIQELLQKVKQLQDQLADLTGQVKETRSELRSTIKLTRSLYRGLTGDDVEQLQEILAADPTIYPEGLVTGYYGPLTEQAVRRFQARFGIASIGIVGPQTIAQIEAQLEGEETIHRNLLNKKPINKDNPAGACRAELAEIGHGPFVAKYATNRNGKNAYGMCVRTMAQQMGGDDEDEDEDEDEEENEDETAPVISAVDVSDISTSTATVSWDTDEDADSTVWYGTSTPLDLDTADDENSSANVMEHEIMLEGLDPDTTYYYVVGSEDEAGNMATSTEGSFTTDAE